MDDILFAAAVEQARLIRTKELSPVELVDAYLDRIDRLDGGINAFVLVRAEEGRAEARRAADLAARGGDLPPLLGVPIPIKDLFDTAGIRTTYGSRAYADHVPEEDAATVRRLKAAGCIVIGKTNTSEFGQIPASDSLLHGLCRNPWEASLTSGGSSGGAAAAVVSGMAPVAHGSDGGGSIRIPASCCGLFGLKPARGRVSSGPRLGESWQGFSTQGVLTRFVADSAVLLDVLSGYEAGDPYWAPPPPRPFGSTFSEEPPRLRVGVTSTAPNGTPVEEGPAAAVEDAARLLDELGHDVVAVDPGWADPDLPAHFVHVIQATSALYPPADPAHYEPVNRMLAEEGRNTSAIDYVRSILWLQAFSRRVVAGWDDFDVLLTPTLPMPTPPAGWILHQEDPFMQLALAAAAVAFTAIANITGQPAMSVPTYWADGVPIGVQLIGSPAGEEPLLRLARQIEAARPWSDRRPSFAA